MGEVFLERPRLLRLLAWSLPVSPAIWELPLPLHLLSYQENEGLALVPLLFF